MRTEHISNILFGADNEKVEKLLLRICKLDKLAPGAGVRKLTFICEAGQIPVAHAEIAIWKLEAEGISIESNAEAAKRRLKAWIDAACEDAADEISGSFEKLLHETTLNLNHIEESVNIKFTKLRHKLWISGLRYADVRWI